MKREKMEQPTSSKRRQEKSKTVILLWKEIPNVIRGREKIRERVERLFKCLENRREGVFGRSPFESAGKKRPPELPHWDEAAHREKNETMKSLGLLLFIPLSHEGNHSASPVRKQPLARSDPKSTKKTE